MRPIAVLEQALMDRQEKAARACVVKSQRRSQVARRFRRRGRCVSLFCGGLGLRGVLTQRRGGAEGCDSDIGSASLRATSRILSAGITAEIRGRGRRLMQG